MLDAAMVLAAQRGDQSAYAAIYDRYADRVHDFLISTLRDPADAADVVEQTFLAAFESVDQLRHPERLEPWLFAIAHRAALERAAERSRPDARSSRTEVLPHAATGADQAATRAELSNFVRRQAAALSPAELALIDLHLRQGLDGQDLADAAGATESEVHLRLTGLRAQIERALGALVVARTNRRECAQMAQLLTASGGRLTPGLREQITRHVDDCEVCNSRRRMVLPKALLAATPLAPVPAGVRTRVLSQCQLGPEDGSVAAAWTFDADGFPNQGSNRQVGPPSSPTPARTRGRPMAPTVVGAAVGPATGAMAFTQAMSSAAWSAPGGSGGSGMPPEPFPGDRTGPPVPWWQKPRWLPLAALATVIVLIAVVTLILASGHGNRPKVSVTATAPSSNNATLPTNPPDSTSPTTNPNTTTSLGTTSTTTSPTSTVAQPGHFVVGATKLDFGTTVVNLPLVVSNDGFGGLSFNATSPSAQLTISPASGTIDPGTNKTLTVSVDRSSAPAGPFSSTVAITSNTGTAVVAIAALIDPGPVIAGELASPAELKSKTCVSPLFVAPPTANIGATLSGPAAIAPDQVILHWQGTAGTGTRPMQFNGSSATANLGPFPNPGAVDWWITATDSAGVTGTSAHHPVTVTCRLA